MKKSFFTLIVVAIYLLPTNAQRVLEYSPNELIVKFRSGVKCDFDNCLKKRMFSNSSLDLLLQRDAIAEVSLIGNREGQRYLCT